LPIAVAKELIKKGYTARPVTGFRGRSGRSFRARLALNQTEDGKWRVEFDEPWAREGAKPPDAEADAADGMAAGGKRATVDERRRRALPARAGRAGRRHGRASRALCRADRRGRPPCRSERAAAWEARA